MNRRAATVALLVAAAGALTYIATADLGQNLVYYWSPSEMQAQGGKAEGATVRLGGLIEAGSIAKEGSELRFRVTDGSHAVLGRSNATPPQMFREGIGVVVEGRLQPDGTFRSSRMMIKHDNEYRAPKAGDKPSAATVVEG